MQFDLSTLALVAIIAPQVVTMVVSLHTNWVSRETRKNTNHLAEQLVEATGEASFAAGRESGRSETNPTGGNGA